MTVSASGGPISDEVERALTQAMREADELFESGKTGGGGTRHYLRDCFYDALERHGLVVVSRAVLTQQEAALGKVQRLVFNAESALRSTLDRDDAVAIAIVNLTDAVDVLAGVRSDG